MWRGAALADFSYEPFAQPAIAELEELRLAALEERFEADLALGAHRELVAELTAVVARNPLRERLREQLMLALYRCGRQAEALDVYQEFRRTLSAELGLDPGPSLQQLELAILARDPALDPPASAAASAPAGSRPTGGLATPAPVIRAENLFPGGRRRTALVQTVGSSLCGSVRLAGASAAGRPRAQHRYRSPSSAAAGAR
jgi:Bacterial transcriptional activator domain